MLLSLNSETIEPLSLDLEQKTPQEIIRWAVETFWPDIGMTSSFQTQSVPLLHMIAQVAPQLPVFFLDTGFHFSETLAFRDQLVQELGLNVQTLTPEIGHETFQKTYGYLYRTDPDLCCHINKVEPLQQAMRGLKAWISGIRRDQTAERRQVPIVSRQADGLYKIAPLATWSRKEVWQYLHDHNLPEHPLLRQGYLSIGCAPCTRPVGEGQDERAGRWAGQEKTECGLHLPLYQRRQEQ